MKLNAAFRLTLFALVLFALNLGRGSQTAFCAEPSAQEELKKTIDRYDAPWLSESGDARFLPLERHKVVELPIDRASTLGHENAIVGFMHVLYWICVVLSACLALCVICYVLRRVWLNRGFRRLSEDVDSRVRRYETLSPEAQERYDDLLTAAQEAFSRGDYRSAIVFYFSWILVEMDKRGFVYLEKGKTNLEYWRELAGASPLRRIYRDVMKAFENAYFGGITPTFDAFDAVWSLRSEFERIMSEKDEENRLAQEGSRTTSASTRALTIALLFGVCGLSGCEKEEAVWRQVYELAPGWYDSQSVNGATAFCEFGKSYGKWKVSRSSRAKIGSQDCLFWFPSYSLSFSYFEMFSASCAWDLVGDFTREGLILSNDAFDSPAFRDAWESNLRRYASCDVESWDRYLSPAFMRDFAMNYGRAREWLESSPNRTLVVFADNWDAVPRYLADSKKSLDPSTDKGKAYLEERQRRLEEACSFSHAFAEERSVELEKRKTAAEKMLEDPDASFAKLWGPNDDRTPRYLTYVPNAEPFSKIDYWANGVDYGDDWNAELLKEEKGADGLREFLTERAELPYSLRYIRSATEFLPDEENEAYGSFEEFSGAESWTKGLPASARLSERVKVEPRGDTKVLLALGDVPLVCERQVGESRLIIVNSTSFVSNYALTDPTNRLLAARLVDEIPRRSKVSFIYGRFPAPSREVQESDDAFTLKEVTPYSVMVWNLFALTAIAAFCSFSIFGRPKRMAKERVNDFSGHIAAVGDAIGKTASGNAWARRRLDEYRNSELMEPLFEEDSPTDGTPPESIDQ